MSLRTEQRDWSDELFSNWPEDVPQPEGLASWLPSARRSEEEAVREVYGGYASGGDIPPLVSEAYRYVLWHNTRYVIPDQPAEEAWTSLTGEGQAARALARISLAFFSEVGEETRGLDPDEVNLRVGRMLENPGGFTEEQKLQILVDMRRLSEPESPDEIKRNLQRAETARNNIIRGFEQDYLGLPPLEIADDDQNIFGDGDLRLTEDGFYVRPDFETKYWWQRHGGEVPTEALATVMGVTSEDLLASIARSAVNPNSAVTEPIPAWSTIRSDNYLLRVMPAEEDPSQVRVTAPICELTRTGTNVLERILRVYEAGMNQPTEP